MLIEPRPYQLEALKAVLTHFHQGVNRSLVVMPTGVGKSLLFSLVVKERSGRAVILANRDELLEQTAEKLRMVIPDPQIGFVHGDRNEIDAPIVIASVQTLMREPRLKQLKADFDTVICDEAHHFVSPGNLKILSYLGCFRKTGAPLTLGLTATPFRTDGIGLDYVFEKIVYRMKLVESILQGYLCDLVAKEIKVDIDFSKLKAEKGDFQDRDLGRVLAAAGIHNILLDAFCRMANPRKTLIFVPSVGLGHLVAETFAKAGIPSAALDCNTPKTTRRMILTAFREGKIRVVVNMGILTEGFDEPSVECIINARPTKSLSLFTQIVGRGLRTDPRKRNCLLLDLVGYSGQHKLMSVSEMTGLPPVEVSRKSVARAAADQHRDYTGIQVQNQAVRGVNTRDLNLFRSQFEWFQVTSNAFRLTISKGFISVSRSPNSIGLWDVWVHQSKEPQPLAQGIRLDYAQGIAEDWVRTNHEETLARADAPWKKLEPTQNQLDAMAKFGEQPFPGMTRGDASAILSRRISRIAS